MKNNFNISFSRDGTKVVAQVGPTPTTRNHPNTHKVYLFQLELGNEEYAELLLIYFRGELRNLMESERRTYYEDGWEDAKKRKRQQKYFKKDCNHTTPF